ncbi:hypothetical protein GCM10027022_09170 [Alpinimonas psychrophila]|uniref:Uncharacterized protein n=1 Tax=Alpinimonas psychrophila TaxID=748908 RepID=A0A7W3JT82_9MICO|nr:hypothetical protein [Alpinimonas psychrophila]
MHPLTFWKGQNHVIHSIMGSTAGRWVRAIVVAAAGIFDFCLFAPFAKRPMNGKKLRASYQGETSSAHS